MEPPPAPPQHHHRLMCSYGGHIVTRPRDKSLCYVGGETRIILVNRQTTLSALIQSLSKNLKRTQSFVVKYQLPNEDLDSLISIATDEDLENMFEEYDRLTSRKSSGRLRLFLFPSKSDSVSALGSTKSGDWFLNALNGDAGRKFLDPSSASVNSLLSLFDDNPICPTKEIRNDTVEMTSSSLEEQLAQISIVPSIAPAPVISDFQNQTDPLLSLLPQKQNCSFDFPSPGSVSSDGSKSNALSQIQTSRSSTEYGYSEQLHHQQQFITQFIQNPHSVAPYYQIYPQHLHPVYYMPTKQATPALKPEIGSVPYRATSTGAPGQAQMNMRGNNVIYGQESGEPVQAHLYYHQAQPKKKQQQQESYTLYGIHTYPDSHKDLKRETEYNSAPVHYSERRSQQI